MKKHNVFVYGTLMKGFCNHNHYLASKANVRFLGKAKVDGYAMYHVSSFPGIVPSQDESILGEVYQVDDNILNQLDILEEEGYMYKRKKEIAYLTTGEKVDVYIYIWQLSIKNRIKVDKMPWKPL